MDDHGTGLARIVLIHLDRASRLGVPRSDLLRAARLTEAHLADPDTRIPVTAFARLWQAITERLPDPALGLRLGGDVRIRELGLVGYTMVFSGTLGAALRRFSRYSRILADTFVVQLDASPEANWVRLDAQPALRAYRQAADARLAAVLAMCRELTGTDVTPLSVQFPYRQPADTREYERFFQAPLEFGALATGFLLDENDLKRPVSSSDETLTGYLDTLAAQVLAQLGEERTVRDHVRRALWSQLSEGLPDLDRVARLLGMGARTLQRRLREEGTSFAAVLAELRQDMAEALLREGRLTVSEVAFLTGYSDAGSFHRAFRRRTGVSPRAFRRRG